METMLNLIIEACFHLEVTPEIWEPLLLKVHAVLWIRLVCLNE